MLHTCGSLDELLEECAVVHGNTVGDLPNLQGGFAIGIVLVIVSCS
jgi:hypothetical protein